MASAAIQSTQWRRHGNSQFEENMAGFGGDKPMLGWSGSSGNEVILQSQAQAGEGPGGCSPGESPITGLALSTLPPFQRAQQLLREMAGLAFRLTEVAGSKIWAGGHNKAGGVQFLPGATLPPQGLAAGTTRDVLAAMEAHQALLLAAVRELQQIQQMDEEQRRVADGLAAHSASMRALARGLRSAHQALEAGLERHQEHRGKRRRRAGLDGLGAGTLDVADLVAYAHRISYTTFAPPEFADGQTPLRNALPPAPQEEQMRASQLYLFSDMDVGLPKPPAPKVSSFLEAVKVEVPGMGMAAPPPMPPPGWKPGMPVEIPPDWKPGMPVDIPMPPDWRPGQPISLPEGLDFLNVPQGWKPGDAVVLPPELQVPQRAALPPPSEILVKAREQPPPPPPAGATIQVAHVQLDLNPELEDDDYGSEYGSEDAASSDDDEDDE